METAPHPSMIFTPSPMLLKLLYTRGSLRNLPDNGGVSFSLKNRLDTVRLTRITQVQVNGRTLGPEQITIDLGNGQIRPATELNRDGGLEFPVGQSITLRLHTNPLPEGMHPVQLQFQTDP